MENLIIVHGVPNTGGQQFWPASTKYSKCLAPFYGFKTKVKQLLVVEKKIVEGKTVVCYTYLRKGEFRDRQGKASDSAYFAITMIEEKTYYLDAVNIYNILDAAFKKYVVPKMLLVNNERGTNTFSFKKDDINGFSPVFEEMAVDIKNFCAKFSYNSDLCPILSIGAGASSGNERINIIDFTDASKGIALLKGNKTFSLSPSYETRETAVRLADASKQIENLSSELQKTSEQLKESEMRCSSLDTDRSSLTAKLQSSDSDMHKLENKAKEYKSQVSELQRQLSVYETSIQKFVDSLPNGIKKITTQIAMAPMASDMSEESERPNEKYQKLMLIFLIVNLIVSIFLMIVNIKLF